MSLITLGKDLRDGMDDLQTGLADAATDIESGLTTIGTYQFISLILVAFNSLGIILIASYLAYKEFKSRSEHSRVYTKDAVLQSIESNNPSMMTAAYTAHLGHRKTASCDNIPRRRSTQRLNG